MRALVITVACLLSTCGSAFAGSVEILSGSKGQNDSVTAMGCRACAPLVEKIPTYIVPQVASGTETVEIREINGQMKLLRTEAWSGGSPVLFITKASDDMIRAAQAKTLPKTIARTETDGAAPAETTQAAAETTLPVIDATATTGALEQAAMATVAPAASQDIDLSSYALRLK